MHPAELSLKLLKNIYINEKYKDNTLLSKLQYNKNKILQLENSVNFIIININNTIEEIRCLLSQHDDELNTFKKYCFCFSSYETIDEHKIYSELLKYI